MKTMKNLYLLALLLLGTLSLSAQIRYVTESGAGSMDGSSWADASPDLQAMIDASAAGNEVWVAAGKYTPTVETTPGDPRSKAFVMKEGVAIYGGFTGTEIQRSQRDWVMNVTTLSGDLDGDDDPVTTDANGDLVFANNGENSYHVIFNNGNSLTATAVLDGFTVSGGNADGDFPDDYGGGVYNRPSSPMLNNCSFSGNRADAAGGGMYNGFFSSPELINCSFSGNQANSSGGGIFNIFSLPELTNCSFSGNQATSGGGMYNRSSSLELTNCSFSGNQATSGGGVYNRDSSPGLTNCSFLDNQANLGGGMHNRFSSPELTNCSLSGNQAGAEGGGMYNDFSSPELTNCSLSGNRAEAIGGAVQNFLVANPTFTNCLIYNNREGTSTTTSGASVANSTSSSSTYSYSLVQNITDGTSNNNLDGSLDPLFVDPPDPANAPTVAGDLRLQVCSPAINAGNNNANTTTDDLAANPRKYNNGIIDLGAYEYQSENISTAAATPNAAVTWMGAASTNWQNGCNWEGRGIPGASNSVTIPGGTPNAPVLQANTTYATQDLTLESGVQLTLPAGSSFDIGGTLLLDGAALTNEGTLAPGATMLQNGGALTNRGRVE